MKVIISDGGRKAAGFSGPANDCVARSIAIAAQRPYAAVYGELSEINARMPKTSGRKTAGVVSASYGIYTTSKLFKDYMRKLGFVWTPTMAIGSGCTVHLKEGELPMGRLVVSVSRHYTCVIDGVIHDLADISRNGTRCVYGIWRLP
jgi:hypothetical protein